MAFVPAYIIIEGINLLRAKHPNLDYQQQERIVVDLVHGLSDRIIEANKEKK